MSPIVVAALVALNLGLIFLLLAAPLGVRTVRLRGADRRAAHAPLAGAVAARRRCRLVGRDPVGRAARRARAPGRGSRLSWEGRDGQPIERKVRAVGRRRRRALSPCASTTIPRSIRRSGPTTAKTVRLGESDGGKPSSPCSAPTAIAALAFLVFRYFAHAARTWRAEAMGRDRSVSHAAACSSIR